MKQSGSEWNGFKRSGALKYLRVGSNTRAIGGIKWTEY